MSKKPNFITILLDDMGWRDLSYAGSDFYESPNIDALREPSRAHMRYVRSAPSPATRPSVPPVDVKYCPRRQRK